MENVKSTPLFASGTVFEVTQEDDEDDEFQSYCLPNAVLIKVLEEMEEELGLNQSAPQERQQPMSLTQLVDTDSHATLSEQDAAERKRVITHMLEMRANLTWNDI